ncbi:hypothetical protein [Paenibacillus wynnii]|uniref:hypothetical protein n=1 Tax=Paenibacillus wynnii TaxID=268407 RepID=UPI002790D931|nr:hypothetical protein [Paenibacillus wynnii]MDQ0193083.1 hypothetical protein [Paenibacillus wynnii]
MNTLRKSLVMGIAGLIFVVGISGCGDGESTHLSKNNLYESIQSENWFSAKRYLDEDNLRTNEKFSLLASYIDLRIGFNVGIMNGEENYDELKGIVDEIKLQLENYDGDFKEQMDSFVSNFDNEYDSFNRQPKVEESETIDMSLPFVGMSEDELLNTLWGKPKDINKTTTKYGVSEQWVYGSNKFVYLDDGIVTAIQE